MAEQHDENQVDLQGHIEPDVGLCSLCLFQLLTRRAQTPFDDEGYAESRYFFDQ